MPKKQRTRRRPNNLEFIGTIMIMAAVYCRLTHPGGPIGPYSFTLQMFLSVMGLTLTFLGTLRRGGVHAVIFVLFCVAAIGVVILAESRQAEIGSPPVAARPYEMAEPTPELVLPHLHSPVMPPIPRSKPPIPRPNVTLPLPVETTFDSPSGRPPKEPLPPRVETTAHAAPSNPFLPKDGSETQLLGGTGGSVFRSVDPRGKPVVGFSHRMGSWASEATVSQLTPLYDRNDSKGPGKTTLAREGYALGALEVAARKYVNAVRPVFMKLTADGQLDPTDSYSAEWIGSPKGRPIQTLGGDGRKILGIHGRRALILDAVGLVLTPAP